MSNNEELSNIGAFDYAVRNRTLEYDWNHGFSDVATSGG